MKKALTITGLVITFLAITTLAGTVWSKTRPAKSYADMDAFSVEWLACPEEDRHEMLDWLLGQKAARSTNYPVDQSQLSGMTQDDIIRLLGAGDSEGTHYFVGSIDSDIIGNLIVPKRDHLSLKYNDDGIIESIKTIS